MDARSDRAQAAPMVVWIIHVAFINAVIAYCLIAQFAIAPRLAPLDPTVNSGATFIVILAVAAVQALAAYRLPLLLKTLEPRPEDTALIYLDKRRVQLVLTDAILEAIAIYGLAGLILGLLDLWQFYVVEIVALALIAGGSPRLSSWIAEFRTRLRREANR